MSKPLLNDLDELVEKNIISAETAGQIAAYYQSRQENSPGRLPMAFPIIGALLLGSGLILIIAHNWDMLGRLMRTVIAFIPLIIGQVLCIYVFTKKKTNRVWMESTAVFLFFAVPACISLIAQIYQVNGTLEGFLLSWIYLTLPLIYIMRSGVVSLLVIALATWYAALVGYSRSELPYAYLGIIALVLLHYYNYYKQPSSNFFHLHNWFLPVSFLIALGAFVEDGYNKHHWIFIAYMALLGIYYLAGQSRLIQQQAWYANPFRALGLVGILSIFFIWTFKDVWSITGIFTGDKRTIAFTYSFARVSYALLAICAALLSIRVNIISVSPFVFALVMLSCFYFPPAGVLIFNLWVLAIGIHYVRKGTASNHLGILNFGLLVIMLLAVFRFFDSDIPFIWRGLIFIAAGAGFFVSNYLIIRKRKKIAS